MKVIRKINKIALATTLIFYLTYYFGLLSQILLGLLQIIFSIILANKFYRNSKYAKKHLLLYWSSVIIEFMLLYFHVNYGETSNDFPQIILFSIFPMLIAIYFTLILNKITKNHENS